MQEKAHQDIINLLYEGMRRMHPSKCVRREFEGQGTHSFSAYERVYILSAGKAAIPMADAAASIFSENLQSCLVVVPKGYETRQIPKGRVLKAEHPVAGEGSLKAANSIVSFIREISAGSLLICCISGGSSSLLSSPAGPITLEELSLVQNILIKSGMNIGELNTVRKHLSTIKGGQLLRYLEDGAGVLNVLLSDVPGDAPSIIGSGPTVADDTTFQDTWNILERYNIMHQLPVSVKEHIEKGMKGEIAETVKEFEIKQSDFRTLVVGSAQMLADTICKEAEKKGWTCRVSDKPYTGNVEEVASRIAAEARDKVAEEGRRNRPLLLVHYGECTVNVMGSGKGGRNQELALRGAIELKGCNDIIWLSMGTDGIDGPTDAAGAIVDGATIERARAKGLDPEGYLKRNDSYHFHKEMDTLLKTGPTSNNLMDITLIAVR